MRNPLLDSGKLTKRKRMDQPEQVFLPDDILIIILIRLDVRDVARCRCVCKRWRYVTSTPQFEDSLIMPMSNLPMILVKNMTFTYSLALALALALPELKCTYKEFCIDKWWGTRTLIHKETGSSYVRDSRYDGYGQPCSQNGFILDRIKVQAGYEYIIRNPIVGEEVKIVLNEEPLDYTLEIFGIYLNPTRKEYCTLWQHDAENQNMANSKQYKLLNLQSNPPLWRNIGRPWKHQCCDYSNAVYSLNHGFMYWFVIDDGKLSVMAFDINTESLTKMPPPDDYLDLEFFYPSSLVVNGDGCVYLVQIDMHKDIAVQIRTLKGRSWTASRCVHHYPNHWGITARGWDNHGPKAIAIVNSELFITGMIEEDQLIQLFVCNLQSGTFRKLEENKEYPLNTMFCAHHPTIAPLRSLRRVIYTHMNPRNT